MDARWGDRGGGPWSWMAVVAVKGDVGGCSGLRATGLDDADSQAAELGPMPAARDAGKFLGAQEELKHLWSR